MERRAGINRPLAYKTRRRRRSIKRLYMFRALLAQPQEALHKRNLVYWVRVMSVGCTRAQPPEDEQVMLETCRGLSFLIN
jgi:hypothetical protein